MKQNTGGTEDIQWSVKMLYAATSNAGKLREFSQAASPAGVEVRALPNLKAITPPEEDARTFAGNADLKAVYYSRHAPGLLVFADDSGLEVEALGGDPGVFSARFADKLGFEGGSGLGRDERNNRCLLSLLHQVEVAGEGEVSRAARFVCALSLARDGQVLLRAEGSVEGDITDAPRGSNGFGYDPLFVLRNRGLTLAELNADEKWAVSHRGRAFRSLLQQLAALSL